MHEWESLSHVRWECKYHVVIIPPILRLVLPRGLGGLGGLLGLLGRLGGLLLRRRRHAN